MPSIGNRIPVFVAAKEVIVWERNSVLGLCMPRTSFLRLNLPPNHQLRQFSPSAVKRLLLDPNWLRLALRLRGSVIPAILPEVLFCVAFGVLISAADIYIVNLHWPVLGSLIPSIVLGLLLVFRTNTAYERFWEGRRQWGNIINASRNLTRLMWTAIDEQTAADRQGKIKAVNLVGAFAIATKQHLRHETFVELQPFLAPHEYQELQSVQNVPLRIALWIESYLHQQHRCGQLSLYQLTYMDELLVLLVDALGSCERILKTPIPLAYAIHLKQLLLLYCLLLPFQLVDDLGWLTGPMVGLIAFTLFGVEEIGIEIENPFGRDLNDLPLDAICITMQQNIHDLISTPAPHQSSLDDVVIPHDHDHYSS